MLDANPTYLLDRPLGDDDRLGTPERRYPMITFACSQCGTKLSVRDELAGRTGRCPACRRRMTVPAPPRASAPAGDCWEEIGKNLAAPPLALGPSPKAAARLAGEKAPPKPTGAHGPHPPKGRGALVWGGGGLVVGLLLGVFAGLTGGVLLGFVFWGRPGPQAPAGNAPRAHPGKSAARETPRESADKAEKQAARPDKDQRRKPPAAAGTEREPAPPKEKEPAWDTPESSTDSGEPGPAPPAKEHPAAPEPEAKPKERSSATGFVAGVEKEDDHVLLLLRSEESTMANYHCYFAPGRAGEIGRLREGEKVRVRGVVESRDFPVVLKECELVR
jgi:hypothetical protein